jgi:zinc transport system permease protein
MEILQYAFMQRAIIAGIFVALSCSLTGVYLVLRRLSLIGDGLAHISFGGLALGMLLKLPPLLTALVTAVIGSLGIQWLKERKIGADAAIAVVFSLGLAIGVVLISMARGFTADLFSFLFGNILAVSTSDVVMVAILGVVTLVTLIFIHKELVFMTFDEEAAKAAGIPVKMLNTVLMILTAVTVILGMRVVGVLLVSSLLVLPPLTARQLAVSFRQTMIASVAAGLLSVLLGLLASAWLDIAPGGTIVLTAGLLFVLSLVYRAITGKSVIC